MIDFYTQMGVNINQATFNQMDKNGDGQITKEEKALFDAELTKSGFDKFDLNEDGIISKDEQQQSIANNIYENNKLELPKNSWKRHQLQRRLCNDRLFFNPYKAIVRGYAFYLDKMANTIKYVFKEYAGKKLDINIIKKVLQNMPKNVQYGDLAGDGLHCSSYKEADVFIELFNKTLQEVSQKEAQVDVAANNILSGVNQDAMTMEENGNLVLKSDLVKDKTAKINTEKIDYDIANKVVDGLNGKLKTLAESHYTLKKIKFNKKLFNKVFSKTKSSILDKLSKGEITNANQVLEKFVSEFNSKWLEASIVDISRKTNNKFLNKIFGLR